MDSETQCFTETSANKTDMLSFQNLSESELAAIENFIKTIDDTISSKSEATIENLIKTIDGNISSKSQATIENMIKTMDWTISSTTQANVVMDYLKQWVPVLYKDINNIQKDKVEKMLFAPLKHYICGGNTEILQNDIQTNAFCKQEFGYYEKAYICEDCDKNQKSFICVDCFKNSPHQNHKYQMLFLKQGGVCSCGIPGLQSSSFSCNMHRTQSISAEDEVMSVDDATTGNISCAEIVSCLENMQKHVAAVEDNATVSTATNAATDSTVENCQNTLECVMSYEERRLKDGFFTLLSYILEASVNPLGSGKKGIAGLKKTDCTLSKFTSPDNLKLEDTFCLVLQRNCKDYDIYQERTMLNVIHDALSKTGYLHLEQKLRNMDQTGRVLLCTKNFKECCILANKLKFPMKAFECVILSRNTLSHQIFAMDLIKWLKELICHQEKLKLCFTQAVFQKPESEVDTILIDQLFTSNSLMWPYARHSTAQILTLCLIFNTDVKIQFIKAFMRNAENCLKHIKSCEEGSSVLFEHLILRIIALESDVVKTTLLEKHDALFLLFSLFYKTNEEGSAMGNVSAGEITFCSKAGNKFTRAAYLVQAMINFLLENTVFIWTEELRKSFLKAFPVLLNIFSLIQNTSRTVVNPIKEWGYFTNSLGVEYYEEIRSLMGQMCSCVVSDPEVYTECVNLLFQKMSKHPPIGIVTEELFTITINKHSASCFRHEDKNKVYCSHLPLSTFFCKIIQLKLQEDAVFVFPANSKQLLDMMYQALEPIFFIRQLDKKAMSRKMVEGQKYERRSEIISNAIAILQMGASIMENNNFLIHIINRLHLVPWMKDLPTVGQEVGSDLQLLLTVLLALVGERWVLYIGEEMTDKSSLRHEVIQLLGLKPMSYSDLCNLLLYKDNKQIEEVLQEVANVKKQTGSDLFVLKPELTNECNIFYYHFDKTRQTEAKKSQLMRLKETNQSSQICSPPLPPKFTSPFKKVEELLYCDVMLETIKFILSKVSVVDEDTSVSELAFEQVLYLIGYALMEEERSTHNLENCFTHRAKEFKLKEILEKMLTRPHLQFQAELISWLIEKWNRILKARNVNQDASLDQQPCLKKAKTTEACCSNRDATNKFLKQMQASLMNTRMLPATFGVELTAGDVEQLPAQNVNKTESPVCLGPNHSESTPYDARYTCIICLSPDVRTCSSSSKNVVMPALIQQSTVLCRDRKLFEPLRSSRTIFAETSSQQHSLQNSLILSSNLAPAPYTSSCGHKMHTECFKDIKDINTDSVEIDLSVPFIFESEFKCPLCNTVSNAVLPVFPAVDDMVQYLPHEATVTVSFDNWYLTLKIIHKGLTSPHINPMNLDRMECLQSSLKWLPSIQNEMLKSLTPEFEAQISKIFPVEDARNIQCTDNFCALSFQISNDNEDFCNLVGKVSFTNKLESRDLQLILTIASGWKTCAYTIHGVERLLRTSNKGLLGNFSDRQAETLRSLILAPMFIYIHDKVMSCVAQTLYATLIQMNNEQGICILDWDPFGLLVALTSTSSFLLHNDISSIPACGTKEQRTLHIVLLSHIICLMLGITWEMEETDVNNSSDGVEALQMLKLVYKSAGLATPLNWPSPGVLWNKLKADCIPFLRCCAIYFHFLTGIVAPQALTKPGGDTFYELTRYLGLSDSCSELLGPRSASLLVMRWTSHPKFSLLVKSNTFIHGPLQVNQLIPLPKLYCDLFNSKHTSAVFADNKRTVLCLVCGEWVNFKTALKKKKLADNISVGCAMHHAYQCGINVGIFLNVLECHLYIVRVPNKGIYYSVPYKDQHDEADPGLKKGAPMFFKPNLYQSLHRLWLSHELLSKIPQNTENNYFSSQQLSIVWSNL